MSLSGFEPTSVGCWVAPDWDLWTTLCQLSHSAAAWLVNFYHLSEEHHYLDCHQCSKDLPLMKGIRTHEPNVIELGVGTFSKSFRSKLGSKRRCYKYFLMTSLSVVVASSVCFEKWLLLLRRNESKLRLEEGPGLNLSYGYWALALARPSFNQAREHLFKLLVSWFLRFTSMLLKI